MLTVKPLSNRCGKRTRRKLRQLRCWKHAHNVRTKCATATLEAIGPPTVADVDPLRELVRNEHADVSYWAAILLGQLEGHSAAAVTSLVNSLHNESALATAKRIAWAVGKIGPRAAQARETLGNLAGGDSRLAKMAAQALDELQSS